MTIEQIYAITHDCAVVFCKERGCRIPRSTCTLLGTCHEHDEFKLFIREYLMKKYYETSRLD